MLRRTVTAALVAASCFVLSAPAAAQQSGLVNVNVSDIRVRLQDIIDHNNINAQIPVDAVVQIPIGLAANVCNLSVAALAQQAAGAAPCNATSQNTNQGEAMAIVRAIQRQ